MFKKMAISQFFFLSFFLFQGDHTLSRKKIVQKPPHNQAGCIVEPHNATRQPKLQFCQRLVKVVTLMCAWVENIANTWLPYTNIWEYFKVP